MQECIVRVVKAKGETSLFDCIFITCNAGKSCLQGGPPTGITDCRREAVAEGIIMHQVAGVGLRCDPTVL